MFSKEHIVDELRRVAGQMGRTPGKRVFEQETGIKESDWLGKYWVKWTDATDEAGLSSNSMRAQIDDAELGELLAVETRRLGHIPNSIELKMIWRERAGFPNPRTFQRRGGNLGMVSLVRAHCATDPEGWADVLALIPDVGEESGTIPIGSPDQLQPSSIVGYVYMIKSGGRYKVGLSIDVQRRLLELNTGMPDAGELIHVITTDDPSGIENYWHRRFASKRIRPDAEWFDLDQADVSAFRRRKFQ